MTGRPPPGRAGRVWLAERIATAGRAAELLEHKQRLLLRERRRLAELAERTGREWRARAADADRWNLRALVAGGRDGLERAGVAGRAEVRLEWATRAGVVYPAVASVTAPAGPAVLPPALEAAAGAGALALDAAVRHAAAASALARVDAELVATVRRLRAVRVRWLPELRERLAALELRLEETEREEVTRLRWAGAG